MMNKIFKAFSFTALLAVAAFTTNASAAIVIDFSTGTLGAGGTLNFAGGEATGTDINIGLMTVDGAGAADGVYNTNALLNFDTAADTITIFGTVAGLGGSLGSTAQTLLSGSFSTWTGGPNPVGGGEFFIGAGPDTKSAILLSELGLNIGTAFEHFGFEIESANGTVISTDIVNTAVPVPAAAWLFGTGLIGLVGVARRRA